MAELFSGIKTTLSAPIGVFDIYTLIFKPTEKLIVDVCTGTESEVLLQCIVSSDSAYISNTGADATANRAAMNILCTFLHRIKRPVPVSDYTSVPITILATLPYSLKNPLLFKSRTFMLVAKPTISFHKICIYILM